MIPNSFMETGNGILKLGLSKADVQTLYSKLHRCLSSNTRSRITYFKFIEEFRKGYAERTLFMWFKNILNADLNMCLLTQKEILA